MGAEVGDSSSALASSWARCTRLTTRLICEQSPNDVPSAADSAAAGGVASAASEQAGQSNHRTALPRACVSTSAPAGCSCRLLLQAASAGRSPLIEEDSRGGGRERRARKRAEERRRAHIAAAAGTA